MHGLSTDVDLTFLNGRTLTSVHGDEYQVRLVFDDDVEASLECDCQVNGVLAPIGEVSDALASLVGKRVLAATHAGNGGVRLAFGPEDEVVLLDSSEEYESYTITSKSGTIVV